MTGPLFWLLAVWAAGFGGFTVFLWGDWASREEFPLWARVVSSAIWPVMLVGVAVERLTGREYP